MNMMPLDMADEILLNKNTNGTNQTNS
jgi:hypothetical protein